MLAEKRPNRQFETRPTENTNVAKRISYADLKEGWNLLIFKDGNLEKKLTVERLNDKGYIFFEPQSTDVLKNLCIPRYKSIPISRGVEIFNYGRQGNGARSHVSIEMNRGYRFEIKKSMAVMA